MRFSVIVPLYNKAQYIEKSVRSILQQDYDDYELIVVNDGSSDGSFEIVKSILEESSAKIISQANQGVSVARNTGISKATGEFICFLDADDWWDPDFLKEMDALIKDYPDAGIYGANYYYVKNGKAQARIDIPTGYIDYFAEYAKIMQMPLTSISVAIPQKVLDDVGDFRRELKLGEDFDLWMRIAFKYKVAFLNRRLAYYNQDVDIKNRGIGRLHDPKSHILWNIEKYSPYEESNADFKQLIDNLRVYSLKPYYISKQHNLTAKIELAKVDWEHQPRETVAEYQKPICILRFKERFMKAGSRIKELFKKII